VITSATTTITENWTKDGKDLDPEQTQNCDWFYLVIWIPTLPCCDLDFHQTIHIKQIYIFIILYAFFSGMYPDIWKKYDG